MIARAEPVTDVEGRAYRTITVRLMPLLFACYILAYLDRINVGFAVLQMREQLGLGDRVYGRAAGIFFAGYFLFQLPSNLALERFGVRRWISGLMVAWGIVSCLMLLVRGPRSFYLLRFLLGAAEAGFFPGIIFYMKRWFPSTARARAVAWFMTANPLAGVVGSPISGALLGLHGSGLAGWQWMFLIEGVPAILLGVMVSRVLTERPEDATWLSGAQREWLLNTLTAENASGAAPPDGSVLRVLVSWRIWMLSLVYFGVATTMYGVTLWLPSLIHGLSGMSYFATGVVAMGPFLVTAVAMVAVGAHSDRTGERRWHVAGSAGLGAMGLTAAAFGSTPTMQIAGVTIGLACGECMAGPFWAMASSCMAGLDAAVAIAMINSVANLGGYFGPDIIGFFRSANGGFRGGLLAIAATLATSGVIALYVSRERANPE